MTKKVSIITTIKHNIGDDFVREGIVSLLRDVDQSITVENIHKHSPVTTVHGFEAVRNLRASRVIEPLLRRLKLNDRVANADLLVQSGAPVYWCHPEGPHCADNEWFRPLIQQRFLSNRRGRKFISLAGGSCQRYYSDGKEVASCQRCKAYIAEFFDACDLTLLRDELAKVMLNAADRDAEVLPCTSIFARDQFKISPKDGGYIVVNFMEYAGHFTFGQPIDRLKWRRNFKQAVKKISVHGRVIAACHTPAEGALVRSIIPDIETYIVPNEYIAFMNFYAGARFALVNRVHAGFMMASFGRPVALIGNDSRARMIKSLNLEAHYVEEVNDALLDQMIEALLSREHSYRDEVESIREQARANYIKKIAGVVAH